MNVSKPDGAAHQAGFSARLFPLKIGLAEYSRSYVRLVNVLVFVFLLVWRAQTAQAQTVTPLGSLNYSALRTAISQFNHFIEYTTNGTVVFTGPIPISTGVEIWADGTNEITLSGNNATNLFTVSRGSTLILSNLVITGGSALGSNGGTNTTTGSNSGSGNGGNGNMGTNGITPMPGGAIFNSGNLFLIDCTLAGNSVVGGSGGNGGNGGNGYVDGGNGGSGGNGGTALGGAIYNNTNGFLLLTNCFVVDNSAIAGSGGVGGAGGSGNYAPGLTGNGGTAGAASGGAIYNAGNCLLYNSTFGTNAVSGGNSAAAQSDRTYGMNGGNGGSGLGGAVYNIGTNLVAVNCTFVGNVNSGGNGGNGGDAVGSQAVQGGNGGNGGSGEGGGIYTVTGISGITNCTIINCTFSTNFVSGGTNGVSGSGPFRGSNGSPGAGSGGCVAVGSGAVVVANSIFAYTSGGPNGSGTIIDKGYNINSDTSKTFTSITSSNNTNPQLGTLGVYTGPNNDYQGVTPTLPLLTNSPAINFVLTTNHPAIDQNGQPRPFDGPSSAGAFQSIALEILSQPQSTNVLNGDPALFTVTATGDGITYQWFNGNGELPDYTNTFFYIPAVDPTLDGNYFVVVSDFNDDSVTSSIVTLTVVTNVSPPSPALLGGPAVSGSNFTFSFGTQNGFTYLIQYKDALTDSVWTTLATNDGTGGVVTNVNAMTNASRFYRVLAD